MYYVLSLAWPLELIRPPAPPPSLSQTLSLVLSSYREHKPADALVPAWGKATPLDITITDPTNKTTWIEAATRGYSWQQLYDTRSSGHTREHSRRQGTKVFPSRRDPWSRICRGYGGGDKEMADVNRRDGGRPTRTRSTPEQTGARAGAFAVRKQIFIVLATNSLDGTCEDVSRYHSSLDWDLPEGLRTDTASYCLACSLY